MNRKFYIWLGAHSRPTAKYVISDYLASHHLKYNMNNNVIKYHKFNLCLWFCFCHCSWTLILFKELNLADQIVYYDSNEPVGQLVGNLQLIHCSNKYVYFAI